MTDIGRDLLFNDWVCGAGRNVLCLKEMKSCICGYVEESRWDIEDLSHTRSTQLHCKIGHWNYSTCNNWILWRKGSYSLWELYFLATAVLKTLLFRFPGGHVYFKEPSSACSLPGVSTFLQALPILPGYEVREDENKGWAAVILNSPLCCTLARFLCHPFFFVGPNTTERSQMPQTIGLWRTVNCVYVWLGC